MKKLFVVFLFLVLSILSGCKGKTDIDDSLIEKIALFNLESNYNDSNIDLDELNKRLKTFINSN